MNKLLTLSGLAAATVAFAALAGCRSAPELTQTDAQVLIQAYYDQHPAAPIILMVNSTGLKQGYDAHYWKLTKVYPNHRWADYTITPKGKQVLSVNGGGDVIQWRPDQDGFGHFFITTAVANRPRVHDVEPLQDDVVANVATAKSAWFIESVDRNGVAQPLQDIAHNPGNKLSSKR
jgi:hypothetical protein